jgi:UV DNA damage endonuclease
MPTTTINLPPASRATGIPIVFDFHHHKFCPGTLSHKEAFELALTTWPPGVRPIVHWSESPEDKTKKLHAHSGE